MSNYIEYNDRIAFHPGYYIKELVEESGLTQEQLAQFLEINQSMITKLENGTRSINTTMLDKICSLFGCSEEFLLGESEEYIPLNFAFHSTGIEAEDLNSIAAVNKIAMNIKYMNELMEERTFKPLRHKYKVTIS